MVSIAMKNADLYATIKEEAHIDHLTGLYNRRFFTEKLSEILAGNKHNNVTLMLLNFDDFKLYNELYGSVDGDAALVQFADVLRYVIGTRGTIGRYGGKEFSVCLPLCGSADAEQIVEQIRSRMALVMSNEQESKKFLTFSAGICTYPSAASTDKQMFTYANMAVDLAKKTGKNKTVVYTHGSNNLKDLSVQNVESIGQEYASTIYALTAAIDAKDHYTFNHSKNVSYLATQLAHAIGLDDEHVEMIRQAGLLHDIGKISIPEHILTKKDRLTNDEYDIMKGHVTNAISMIRHLPSLDYVIPIAISHHERYDGRGYPRGLAGENIPVGGRCLAVADAFDAIVSKRPYKEEMPISDALLEIERNLGLQFDPVIGRAFVDYVRSGLIKTDCYDR
jgi:diguanylate cyclase (GGDEF)-like protein/putative nucleotidyltransferase with HDIG domain